MWFIPPTASNSSLKGGLFCHRRQGYDVFAWKMHGFGGGRYQALVVLDSKIMFEGNNINQNFAIPRYDEVIS